MASTSRQLNRRSAAAAEANLADAEATIQKFQGLKQTLIQTLNLIVESGKQHVLREDVDRLTYYLGIVDDGTLLRHFGPDLLRGFISRVHQLKLLLHLITPPPPRKYTTKLYLSNRDQRVDVGLCKIKLEPPQFDEDDADPVLEMVTASPEVPESGPGNETLQVQQSDEGALEMGTEEIPIKLE